jgi:hypothetical protein
LTVILISVPPRNLLPFCYFCTGRKFFCREGVTEIVNAPSDVLSTVQFTAAISIASVRNIDYLPIAPKIYNSVGWVVSDRFC